VDEEFGDKKSSVSNVSEKTRLSKSQWYWGWIFSIWCWCLLCTV